MDTVEPTENKILDAALVLFFRQGIKKTGLEEVAHRAGVTRITVYRYFSDKRALTGAVLMRVPAILAAVQVRLVEYPPKNVEAILDEIAEQMAGLPAGDFPVLLEELSRVYPEIWQQVHTARLQAVGMLFDELFALAERQGRLRMGLNRAVVQAYFLSAVVNVLEGASLVAQGLSAQEVFQTVKEIFLYGILQEA
jgi:AcrR family transcriptional regulator